MGPAARRAEDEPHEGGEPEGGGSGQSQISQNGSAVRQEGHRTEDHDQAERSEDVDSRHQPSDAIGRRADEVENLVFGTRVYVGDRQPDQNDDQCGPQPKPVRASSPPIPISLRSEDDRTPDARPDGP